LQQTGKKEHFAMLLPREMSGALSIALRAASLSLRKSYYQIDDQQNMDLAPHTVLWTRNMHADAARILKGAVNAELPSSRNFRTILKK